MASVRKILIGISGKKYSGKSTAAKVLTYDFGFDETTFAEPLKQATAVLFNWDHLDLNNGPEKEVVDPRWGVSPRFVLQNMGTDYLRNTFRDDFFLRNLQNRLEGHQPTLLVISDVRFPNEVEYIKNRGGYVWRIERPGLTYPKDQHPSETALDDYQGFDEVIVNDGRLDDFRKKVVEVYEGLVRGHELV